MFIIQIHQELLVFTFTVLIHSQMININLENKASLAKNKIVKSIGGLYTYKYKCQVHIHFKEKCQIKHM